LLQDELQLRFAGDLDLVTLLHDRPNPTSNSANRGTHTGVPRYGANGRAEPCAPEQPAERPAA
jgi:hypothetical protein